MKRVSVVMAAMILAAAVNANVVVLDDFSGDLSNWTSTTILDNNGGARNTKAWQISDGKLQLATTGYDGIEQYAFIFNGATLGVGHELQLDFSRANTGSQDLGLYVGGAAPQDLVRNNYVAVYARNTGEVFSRGFDGTAEFDLAGNWNNVALNRLFIARIDDNTYETGYYIGDVRTVLVTRTPNTANDATYIGIYADVRGAGTLGYVDNFQVVIPEPATMILLGLGGLGLLKRRTR